MESKDEPASSSAPETGYGGLNRALLDSALDCIISMDAKGRVLEFNRAAERVFGYSRDEALGQELASLIIPPRAARSTSQGAPTLSRDKRRTGSGETAGNYRYPRGRLGDPSRTRDQRSAQWERTYFYRLSARYHGSASRRRSEPPPRGDHSVFRRRHYQQRSQWNHH